MTTLRALIAAGLIVGTFGWSVAKLPPPPPMDEKAKAAAEEKKAKDAATAEAEKAALTRAQDRVASHYIAEQRAKGKIVTPQVASAPQAAPAAAKGPPAKAAKAAKATKAASPSQKK